jgi:hypothetical protein
MPIRFLCESCQTQLTISRRFAGQRGRCPGCKRRIRVPSISVADPLAGDKPEWQAGDKPEWQAGDPNGSQADQVVATLRFDPDADAAFADHSLPGGDPGPPGFSEKILVARWVVYVQAALLGIVATSFFVFGLAVGSNTGVRSPELPGKTQVSASGLVVFRENGLEEVDTGAVVMFLPVDKYPDPRPEPDGLLPDRFVPLDNPAIESLRAIGGAVVRVDRIGRYQARLRSGSYWLLVLSRNRSSPNREIEKQVRADLGDYFFPVEDLLGDRAFHWQKIRLIEAEQELTRVVF